MPIESGTTIEDLDNLWPLSSDALLEGDNHLRLIKSVLKAQFPGVGGLGFAIPITAVETEINFLSGVTSNIQDQLDALEADFQAQLYAPPGTVMLFFQATVPLGWTQLASNNDSMLRVVSGAGGGAGGSDSPISLSWTHAHTTGSHILSISEIPAHNHGIRTRLYGNSSGSGDSSTVGRGSDASVNSFDTVIESTGGGSAHNHGSTNSQGFTFLPKYINVITGVKD